MVSVKYARAYTEVLELLRHLSIEEYEKIPQNEIEYYKQNKDKEYIFEMDDTKSLQEQNISKEANSIIVTIFRDYFASVKQKEKLKEILENNSRKTEEMKQERYADVELFKEKKVKIEESSTKDINNTDIVVYKKENIIIRIFRRIRKLF